MKNILLCGVGGQGTVLASKLIAQAAMDMGLCARSAETIGMAQRGGAVVSHVRIGEHINSPLIPMKKADIDKIIFTANFSVFLSCFANSSSREIFNIRFFAKSLCGFFSSDSLREFSTILSSLFKTFDLKSYL